MFTFTCSRMLPRAMRETTIRFSSAGAPFPVDTRRDEEVLGNGDLSCLELFSSCDMTAPLISGVVRPPLFTPQTFRSRHRAYSKTMRTLLRQPSQTAPRSTMPPVTGRVCASSSFKLRMAVPGVGARLLQFLLSLFLHHGASSGRRLLLPLSFPGRRRDKAHDHHRLPSFIPTFPS